MIDREILIDLLDEAGASSWKENQEELADAILALERKPDYLFIGKGMTPEFAMAFSDIFMDKEIRVEIYEKKD